MCLATLPVHHQWQQDRTGPPTVPARSFNLPPFVTLSVRRAPAWPFQDDWLTLLSERMSESACFKGERVQHTKQWRTRGKLVYQCWLEIAKHMETSIEADEGKMPPTPAVDSAGCQAHQQNSMTTCLIKVQYASESGLSATHPPKLLPQEPGASLFLKGNDPSSPSLPSSSPGLWEVAKHIPPQTSTSQLPIGHH